MKHGLVVTICVLLFVNIGLAQQVELGGVYSFGTSHWFGTGDGFEVAYNQIFNKNKLGLGVTTMFSNHLYSYHFVTNDHSSFLTKNVNPKNKKISLQLSYDRALYQSEESSLFLGGFVSANYILINEQEKGKIFFYNYNNTDLVFQGTYNHDKDEKMLRFGVGIDIEYEIIFGNFSTSLKIAPEYIHIEKSKEGASDATYSICNVNNNISLKYRFK